MTCEERTHTLIAASPCCGMMCDVSWTMPWIFVIALLLIPGQNIILSESVAVCSLIAVSTNNSPYSSGVERHGGWCVRLVVPLSVLYRVRHNHVLEKAVNLFFWREWGNALDLLVFELSYRITCLCCLQILLFTWRFVNYNNIDYRFTVVEVDWLSCDHGR